MAESDEVPRRNDMSRLVPAEQAIFAAMEAVEAMPADVRLTDAVVLLGQARERVADFVDGVASPHVSSASLAAPPAPPTRDELLGESMNRGLRHELLRQEADRQGKSLCLVRSPKGEWQLGYGEGASNLDWLGHGSTPDKAIQNALETDTVLNALAEDIPWHKT